MRQTHSESFYAYIAAFIYTVIIGFSFMFTKIALDHANPIDTLTYRFTLSLIVIVGLMATGVFRFSWRGKPFLRLLALASMYPIGFFTLQAYGLREATSAEGGILYAITPILVALLAGWFLKERTSALQKLSILVSVSGVLFIFIMQGSSIDLSHLSGLILLALSSLASAGFTVLSRHLLRTFTPAEVTSGLMIIGCVTFWIVSLVNHTAAGTMSQLFTPLTHLEFIGSIAYLSIFATFGTSFASSYALARIEASKMSVFANLSTLISIAAGAMMLGESITVWQLLGAMLIIIGVIGTNLPKPSLSRRAGTHMKQQA